MNYVHIVGRLAKDPETRFTAGGQKVTVLIVATNNVRAGNEETVWWRVTLWGDRWDKMLQYLTKGKLVMVGGDMRKPEIYTDKNGAPQIGSIEVTADYVKFVPGGRQDQPGTDGGQAQASPQAGFQRSNPQYAPHAPHASAQNYRAGFNRDAEASAHSAENDFSLLENISEEEPLPF